MADLYFGEFSPVATRDDHGFIAVHWPEDAPTMCRISREVLLRMVDQLNAMRAAGNALDEAMSGVSCAGTPETMSALMEAHRQWLEARRG